MSISEDLRLSDERGEDLRGWWDYVHGTNLPFWLSGTTPEVVWERLGVAHLLVPGAQVLEIGIGTGNCARAMADRGCVVSALDISPLALAKVADFAKGYLAEDSVTCLLPHSTFDVVLSHQVAQHMLERDLAVQMAAVVAALKPAGIFAMQFADADASAHDESLLGAKCGGICRSPGKMREMACAAGAAVASLTRGEHWEEYGSNFYTIHLVRGTAR